jgi:purine-binding chemotaxis protein CheW
MPVFDLRTRLGLPSLKEENEAFIEMLSQREQDHLAWIGELEASIREKREFKLTTDPHRCAFGKWYDGFRSDSLLLTGLLRKFDLPHRAVHEVGTSARALFDEGRPEEALALVSASRKGVLSYLLGCFAAVRELLASDTREVVVIIDAERPHAVAVDSVVSVEALDHSAVADSDEVLGRWKSDVVTQIARRRAAKSLVLLLDAERLASA